MKNIIYILSLIVLFGCNAESDLDCFKSAGAIVNQEYNDLEDFTKITTFKNVELFIEQGETQQVVLETGENLINDTEVYVENGRLILKDNTSCNLTRSYGLTKVYVITPNLTEIRNASNLDIHSIGVLNFSQLKLISEDFTGDYYSVGRFNMEVNCTNLSVVINNLTTTILSGTTNNLRVSHVSGNGRFEGRNLIADRVNIFHRGTNDIIVNPQLSLTANIVSTGNVISYNRPPVRNIEQPLQGSVIYRD